MEIIKGLNSIFWGWLVAGVLLSCGVYFTFRLRAPQLRYFTKLLSNLKHANADEGGVSGFGALCAAVGSEVGTGSLVGVATALASGGPGAIFWMWVTAVFGMPIMFSEAVLGQLFRVKNDDGTYRGGPAYYMEKGLHSKILPTLFSISLIIGIGCIYVMIQSNSIAASITGIAPVAPAWAGAVLVVIVGVVIFGGIKRLSDVASYVVPFMALAYILLALFVVVTHIEFFFDTLVMIVKSAFGFNQVAGGVVGGAVSYSIQEAFRYGVARGLFSNDAGNGTTPGMHASANVKHPVNQGLSGMLGVFTTTIVVCSCTAFCILLSGQLGNGETGIQLTQSAFATSFGDFGKWIVFIAMFLFGYTTLLADIYYGEINALWLFPKGGKKLVTGWRVISCGLILLGSVLPVSSLWELADFCGAFLVFFNVIALIGLSKYVVFALKDFEKKQAPGVYPYWDYDTDVIDQYNQAKGGNK
jgi:AGCS family alanine or glycine:cation symporter